MNVKIQNLLHNLQQRSLKELISLYIESYKKQILIAIVFFAFLIRIKRIAQGLPYILNPFEVEYLENSFTLLKNGFSIYSFEVPFFFVFLNTITLFLSTLNMNLSDYVAALEVNPQDLYTPLRYLSIFFSLGSIVVIYFIGKYFSTLIGLLASLFFTFSLISVQYSHLLSPHSALVFFTLLALFFSIKSSNENTNKNYSLAFIFATLSASMHYIGIFNYLIPVMVLFFNKENDKLKKYATLFSIVFIVLNPFFIFNLVDFIFTSIHRYVHGYYIFHFSSFFLYGYQFIVQSIGPVVYCTALIFFFKYCSEYDKNLQRIIFTLPVLCIICFTLFHFTHASYTTLLVPYFCLASAMFFNSLSLKEENKFIFIVLILFALWIPYKYVDRYNKTIGLSDTRIIAAEWLRQKTSEDSKIIYSKKTLQLEWFDPYSKDLLKEDVDDPDLLINRERFSLSSKVMKKKDWYKVLKKEADYVVISSIDIEKAYRQPGYVYQKKFYKKFEKLKPLIVFNPYLREYDRYTDNYFYDEFFYPFLSLWQRERSGPVIKIYKI